MAVEHDHLTNPLATQREQHELDERRWQAQGVEEIRQIIARARELVPDIKVDALGSLYSRKDMHQLAIGTWTEEQQQAVDSYAQAIDEVMQEYRLERLPDELISLESRN